LGLHAGSHDAIAYQMGVKQKHEKANYSTTIKEVTGENFFTQYGDGFLQDAPRRKGPINQYEIDEKAKVICFCQQRLGKINKCPHAETDDVDEISKIIQEQAKDFLAADKYTHEDISTVKQGLEKVEFVRSQNYLNKLAVMIHKQEKEIFKLKQTSYHVNQLEQENLDLKQQITKLETQL
jgi:hypothetical protein